MLFIKFNRNDGTNVIIRHDLIRTIEEINDSSIMVYSEDLPPFSFSIDANEYASKVHSDERSDFVEIDENDDEEEDGGEGENGGDDTITDDNIDDLIV
jgi:hypothetical protein